MKKFVYFPLLLATCVGPSQANSSNVTNTSTVVSSCTIAVVKNLEFGPFNPLEDTTKIGEGVLRVNCTKGSYRLELNRGLNAVTDATRDNNPCTRRMMSADKTSFVTYELNYDGWYTNTTSCAMTTSKTVSFTSPGAQDIPVQGRFLGNRKFSNLNSSGVVLTDTVSVTVIF